MTEVCLKFRITRALRSTVKIYHNVSAMCLFVLAGDGSEDSGVELKREAADVVDDCPLREVQDPVASTDGITENLNVSELMMPKCRRDGHFNLC